MDDKEYINSIIVLDKCVHKYWEINHSRKPKDQKHALKLGLCRHMAKTIKEHLSIQNEYLMKISNEVEVLNNRLKRMEEGHNAVVTDMDYGRDR
ncbi:hypothetical protein KAR91_69920 [Candidatus Pacearchaeota archaeon]|nr:hypothetical protein [Candidatus Pacearchaeota archaeon]